MLRFSWLDEKKQQSPFKGFPLGLKATIYVGGGGH